MKKGFKKIGILLVAIGIFLIIIQPLTLTGAVIDLSTTNSKISFLIGLTLLITGIILLSFGRQEGLLTTIERTKKFEKEIKRVDLRAVERAIEKIGTGLAREKPLHKYYGGGYSIRIDKGGRIFYDMRPDGSIILTRYKASSEHS